MDTKQELLVGQRKAWRFQYQVSEILTAIEDDLDRHRERLEWWNNEKASTEAKIKETAVEFRHEEYTGGSRMEVTVDPTLGKRLSECDQKISTHRGRIGVLIQWKAFLEHQEGTLELDINDVEFFALGVEAQAE